MSQYYSSKHLYKFKHLITNKKKLMIAYNDKLLFCRHVLIFEITLN